MDPKNRHIALTNLYEDEVVDFLREAGFDQAELMPFMSRLIAAMIDYRIEEVSYFPVVYIVDHLEKMDEVLGQHQRIRLGISNTAETAAEELLLKGAPLSTDHWRIYVQPTESGFEYGLFGGLSLPIGHEPRHILVSLEQQRMKVVKAARISNRCLELESNRAFTRRFFFSADGDISRSPYELVNRIAGLAVRDVAPEIQDSVREFLFSTIKHGILGSHGALIAMIDHRVEKLPGCFTDAVLLDPPIRIAETLREHLNRQDVTSFSALIGLSDLVTGALHSDGITILRSDGVLLAYRAFCAFEQVGRPIHGGARKRAYEALKSEVARGGVLLGTFIHSQDGWMDMVEQS